LLDHLSSIDGGKKRLDRLADWIRLVELDP
jgi:hypothetical protein